MTKWSTMNILLVSLAAVAVLIISNAEALECGIHLSDNEQLKETISKCLKTNKTLEDLWDLTSMSVSDSDEGEEETQTVSVDDKLLRAVRSPQLVSSNNEDANPTNNDEANNAKELQPSNPVDTETVTGETCFVQCVFDTLGMSDNGYPNRDKVLEGLLKTAPGREFRDFIQDTTDDCFQELDTSLDQCTYSSKLLTCLADRGKENCADWPVGNLPFAN